MAEHNWVERADSFLTSISSATGPSGFQWSGDATSAAAAAFYAKLYDRAWLCRKIIDLPVDMALKDGFDEKADPAAEGEKPEPDGPKPAVEPKTDAFPPAKPGAAPVPGADPLTPAAPPPKPDGKDSEVYRLFKERTFDDVHPDGIFHRTCKLARLFGGHVLLLGGVRDPKIPFEVGEEIVWLDEAARSEVEVTEWDEDANSPRYRQPVMFKINSDHARGPLEIHYTRVRILPGITTGHRPNWKDRHWTLSVLDPVLSTIVAYWEAMEGVRKGVARFDVGVLKSKALFSALDMLNKTEINARQRVLSAGVKNERILFLDDEEEYTRHPLNFGGLKDAVGLIRSDVAGATGISEASIFGVSVSGGLAATGDVESEALDDHVEMYRENVLAPALSWLMSALLGKEIEVDFVKGETAADPNADPNGVNPAAGTVGTKAIQKGVTRTPATKKAPDDSDTRGPA